jgi:hypothetical protein
VIKLLETLVLKNPIKINDKEVKKVTYDFEELTPADMAEAEKRMIEKQKIAAQMEEFNYTWHSYLFAAAAVKTNPENDLLDYMRLKGSDALKARKLGRNFILAAEDGEEQNSDEQQ